MNDARNDGTIRLTEHSPGAGCGCKRSPAVLCSIQGASGPTSGLRDPRPGPRIAAVEHA